MGETIVLPCHIISQRTGKTFCPQNQFSFDINNTVTKPQRKATPCDWISLKINFHLVFSGKIVNPLNEHHAGNSEEYEVISKSTPWKYLWDICCMWSILVITSSLIIAMYPSRMPFSTQGRTHAALFHSLHWHRGSVQLFLTCASNSSSTHSKGFKLSIWITWGSYKIWLQIEFPGRCPSILLSLTLWVYCYSFNKITRCIHSWRDAAIQLY